MGSSPSAPSVPTQAEQMAGQEQAAALTQKYGQYGGVNPFGSITFTGEPGQDRKMEVSSPLLDALAGEMSTSYGSEAAERAEGAVYDTFTQKYDPIFSRQEETLKNQLIQQGIPVGSEAYDRAIGDLYENQENARLSAMNQSVLTGEQTQGSQLARLLSMTEAANPLKFYQPGIGGTPQFSNTVTDTYAMNLNNYQNELEAYNSKWGTLGGLGAAAIGGAFAGPLGAALAGSAAGTGGSSNIPQYLARPSWMNYGE